MSNWIPYPWQQPLWQSFLVQVERDKLPHGLMLSGQKGMGKWHYGQLMAHYLLCTSPNAGLPCGQCRACDLLASGNHPDLFFVQPEEANKPIKVDQIRELSAFVAKTAQQQGYKVALIGPVEQLNTNAGNALLKSLEEPAGRTLLILTTNVTSGVMATIRSRCQLQAMPVPQKTVSLDWLERLGSSDDAEILLRISAGSPLLALELAEGNRRESLLLFLIGLSAIAEQGGRVNPGLSKEWLSLELVDMIDWWIQVINLLVHSTHRRDIPDSSQGEIAQLLLKIMASAANVRQGWVYKLLDRMLLLKRQLLAGANPNKQLLIEELLLDWGAVIATAKPAVND